MSNQIVRAADMLEKSGVIADVIDVMVISREGDALWVQLASAEAVRKLAAAHDAKTLTNQGRTNGAYGRLYSEVSTVIDGVEYVGIERSHSRAHAVLSAAKVAFIAGALGNDIDKIASISCNTDEVDVFLPQGAEAVRRIAEAHGAVAVKENSALEENGIKRESEYIAVFVGGIKFFAGVA